MLHYDGAGVFQARYTQGDGTDQPLEFERGGQRYFYEANHLGSIRTVRNASGVAVNQYDYDAYGQSGVCVETVPQPYGFTGREFDAESGLYHYRALQLDRHTGRFIQEDPIGFDGGDLVVYRYVWDSPQNWTDPTGRSAAAEEAGLDNLVSKAALALIACKSSQVFLEVALALSGDTAVGPSGLCGATGIYSPPIMLPMADEHDKGARPSTREKHQKGRARNKRDRGGEKADDRRQPYGKKPHRW